MFQVQVIIQSQVTIHAELCKNSKHEDKGESIKCNMSHI